LQLGHVKHLIAQLATDGFDRFARRACPMPAAMRFRVCWCLKLFLLDLPTLLPANDISQSSGRSSFCLHPYL